MCIRDSDKTDEAASYTRDRFRDRSGFTVTGTAGNSLPALFHKADANQPGAVGSILGVIRDLGDVEQILTHHVSDSIAVWDLTGLQLSSGYKDANNWGIGIRRLKRGTPDIDLMIAGHWLPREQG